MSLFESFKLMDRGWESRALENQSLRSMFVWLVLDLVMLGMLTITIISDLVRLHRFDWSGAVLLPVFILPAFRFSRLIYRHLGP
jgi:hypothetical protein